MDELSPAFWNGRSVGVTGATGFVGWHLVRDLLSLGARVTFLVRDWVPHLVTGASLVRGALEDRDIVERFVGEYEVQTLLHLAAQTQVGVANQNPLSTYEANIRGTWTLMEVCRHSKVEQVIVASSDKAYGAQPTLPYTEQMPLLGVNPYDVSKTCADLICQSYAKVYGVPVAITRCGNIFGPDDPNQKRLIPSTIRSYLRNERPQIRSDGTMTRDYLYVADAVTAYLRLAEVMAENRCLAGEAFNFSMESPLSVLDVVHLIQKIIGSDLEPEVLGTAKNEIQDQFLSSAKARNILGWEPRYDMEAGLRSTIAKTIYES